MQKLVFFVNILILSVFISYYSNLVATAKSDIKNTNSHNNNLSSNKIKTLIYKNSKLNSKESSDQYSIDPALESDILNKNDLLNSMHVIRFLDKNNQQNTKKENQPDLIDLISPWLISFSLLGLIFLVIRIANKR